MRCARRFSDHSFHWAQKFGSSASPSLPLRLRALPREPAATRTTTIMDTPTPPQTTSFSHQAAKLSWVCPILVVLLLACGGRVGARVILELAALLLIVVGFVFGLIALFGVRAHGSRSILAPALVGILINGLLLFIFVTNFVAARARARQQRSDVSVPTVVVGVAQLASGA